MNAASTRPQCTLKQKRYKVVPTNVSAADVVFSDPLHAIGNQGTNEVYFARLDQVEPAATRTVYGKLDQGALKQPMLAPKPVHLGKADTVALQQRLTRALTDSGKSIKSTHTGSSRPVAGK